MPRDGSATRERILDAAQALILERGYAGVSIDSVLAEVGITKGAFFYHFRTKGDLARALIRRFGEADLALMREFNAKAQRLGRDPLQRLLIFVGLFEEMFEESEHPLTGCLFASYTYELEQFDDDIRKFVASSFTHWREFLKEWLDEIAARHPPRLPVDTASLADAFTVVIEGAYVTARALDDQTVLPAQLRHFRNYLELLFPPQQG